MRPRPCRMFSCEFIGHLRGYYCKGCPYLAALPAPWDEEADDE